MEKPAKKSRSRKWIIAAIISIVAILSVFSAITAISSGVKTGNTAHIKITGAITSGSEDTLLGGATASAEYISSSIEKADKNPAIKAILLDINSPGGSAVASEEVATSVKKAKKPVVALIRDIGTSGAYWAASSADEIVASPLSITGSVGATASYLQFSGLMEQYGIGYERIVSGEFKDTGAPFRKLNEEESRLLQEMINTTGIYFAQQVKENRKLNDETLKAVSTARIYTGQQAKELGLIDRLGNMETAKEVIKEKTGVKKVSIVEYKQRKPFSITSMLSQQAATIGRSMAAALMPQKASISLS